ncbi:excisionase family protein [Laribacter hongkongensis]|uniref:excisionase family protein n=1 Tax=Laribacter hongkongensis TaxID=168471 RepID=UPI001EFC938F|nr:excisionase family protein [Laribacter hongkongensis]MCG8990832.1 excisionase family protein [Laribacter hongkongensis]MCG9001921.1 excisionase family protein [Laribacter hongkongensis]MCG9005737.1 excisionase family protein [Laribacter hongkongensis]MCG9014599.1 excisionase family protein [Laribacter hongkongensis]MCG9021259.1 excisionase family protein [Laribacter hongkongensis]
MLKWVKLEKYCELTGETTDSVEAKRRTGKWIEGTHWRIPADGRVWINLEEVEKWVSQSQPLRRRAA